MVSGIAEYDSIALDYRDSKELPFRKWIETTTLLEILGNVANKTIIDLACGEGYYTRKLKLAGARSCHGIDISAEMIYLAKQQEDQYPIGCTFQCSDVNAVSVKNQVDVVSAMYLLNYARSPQELLNFCQVAFDALKPGGKFAGCNDNIFADPELGDTYHKYGFSKKHQNPQIQGDPIEYTFYVDDHSFQFNNYYLSPQTYLWAFTTAGFKEFRWVSPFLHWSQHGEDYWDHFMIHPPIMGFKAIKL